MSDAPERAVALIGATMIENRLKKAIIAHTLTNSEVQKDMFAVGAPLGGFSAKIDLAYMLQIITKAAHSDLKKIAWVRNQFAHRIDVSDFDFDEKVQKYIMGLQLIETHVGNSTGAKGERVISFSSADLPRMNVHHYEIKKSTPRTRFIMTVQLFTIAAAISDKKGSGVPFI